ncbi:A24 family peptidase [Gottfriedia sp. S16(2024)]|uniref:A24 family peptidase n=1 Tax=Gottfriedia sp. S16(2024) TaxID=3162883 RepID=UPI003D24A755
MIIKTVLAIVLLISLITDIRNRKILNIVTLPAIFFGFIYYTITLGFDGLIFSSKGFLAGLGFLIIPYLLGGMGAGDVKLMAAIGALMGTIFTFYAFIYTAVIGGIIGIILIIKRRGAWNSIKSLFYTLAFQNSNLGFKLTNQDNQTKILFPYGVPIVLGTICATVLGIR